jgi:hypothetical protein
VFDATGTSHSNMVLNSPLISALLNCSKKLKPRRSKSQENYDYEIDKDFHSSNFHILLWFPFPLPNSKWFMKVNIFHFETNSWAPGK